MRRIALVIFVLAVVSAGLWVFAKSYTVSWQAREEGFGYIYNLETGESTRFEVERDFTILVKPYQHLLPAFSATAIILSAALCGLIVFKKLGLKITVSRTQTMF